jgi:hypothetical protein
VPASATKTPIISSHVADLSGIERIKYSRR